MSTLQAKAEPLAGDAHDVEQLHTAADVAEVLPRTRLEGLIAACPDDKVADLIGELARAQAVLSVRLQRPHTRQRAGVRQFDQYLTASEVAVLLAVRKKWVYDHRERLGGIKIEGHVRFPQKAIRHAVQGWA